MGEDEEDEDGNSSREAVKVAVRVRPSSTNQTEAEKVDHKVPTKKGSEKWRHITVAPQVLRCLGRDRVSLSTQSQQVGTHKLFCVNFEVEK